MQHCDGSGEGYPKDGSVTDSTRRGRAVQFAVVALDQGGAGGTTVGAASEVVNHGFGTAWRELENESGSACASGWRGSIKVAITGLDQLRRSVGRRKGIQRGYGGGGSREGK